MILRSIGIVLVFTTVTFAQEDGDYTYSQPVDPPVMDSSDYSTQYEDPSAYVQPAPVQDYIPSSDAVDVSE